MQQTPERGTDDLWRGNRLILALVLVVGALAGLVALQVAPSRSSDPGLNVLVASYDVAASGPQRFVVGLVTDDQEALAYGTAQLSFSFLGDEGASPIEGPIVSAVWQPVPGTPEGDHPGPRVGDVNGVYVARDVVFDRPGFWEVDVSIDVDGEELRADAAFEVRREHLYLAPGDDAPRTVQALAGTEPARAVDSRADAGASVPDPALHARTVADAIAAGRPTMVVVSTPVYCVSRFCGPITEAVEALAARFGDRMAFIHLEVWSDFEAKDLNPAAAEWIRPAGADEATEPWVWVIDDAGVIVDRFDNIASERELEDAVRAAIST